MKLKDIIALADECGVDPVGYDRCIKFAKLVAAAERENICKQIAALHDSISLVSDAAIKVRGEP